MAFSVLPEEPYQDVVSQIEIRFRLRREDAIQRALVQLRAWTATASSLRRRKDAAGEARLQKHIDHIQKLIKANAGKFSPRSDGATAELLSKPSARDSITSLEEAGRLSPEQVAACREIQKVVEIITRGTHAKCQTYQSGSSTGWRPSSLMSAEIAYSWSQKYVPWHAALAKRKDKRLKRIAEMVIIDGRSLDWSRRVLQMSSQRGLDYLVDAVDLYIEIKDKVSNYDPDKDPMLTGA